MRWYIGALRSKCVLMNQISSDVDDSLFHSNGIACQDLPNTNRKGKRRHVRVVQPTQSKFVYSITTTKQESTLSVKARRSLWKNQQPTCKFVQSTFLFREIFIACKSQKRPKHIHFWRFLWPHLRDKIGKQPTMRQASLTEVKDLHSTVVCLAGNCNNCNCTRSGGFRFRAVKSYPDPVLTKKLAKLGTPAKMAQLVDLRALLCMSSDRKSMDKPGFTD